MKTLKLATWNLNQPKSARRCRAIRSYTDREKADVWVLTEVHDSFSLGHSFSHSSAPGCDGDSQPESRWVTIWSRHPVEPLVTSDKKRTAAVRITPDFGSPFIVYGTVLPWNGSTWRGYPSAGGVAFKEALAVQSEDWLRLQRENPDDEFFLLGDLNQTLVSESPQYYGSRANRTAIEAAFLKTGLVALTAGEQDPVRRDSAPCACIDHICARIDSKWIPEPAVRWPDTPFPERWMTDHFGVSIQLRLG